MSEPIEIDTSHTTEPWVLVVYRAWDGKQTREMHTFATEEQAKERARSLSAVESVYLIELMVDAGCLHAVG